MSLSGERGGRIQGWVRSSAPLLALALGLVFVAACSNDDDLDAATTTTTRARSTTTEPGGEAEEADLLARYEAYWEARFEANQPPPNPDHPGLREYATGRQLEQVVEETRRNLEEEVALRHADSPAEEGWVKVVSIDGDTATVQECVVDDDVLYRYTTGDVVNDDVATHSVIATMSKVDGKWKLEGARLAQRWEGVAGCALAES